MTNTEGTSSVHAAHSPCLPIDFFCISHRKQFLNERKLYLPKTLFCPSWNCDNKLIVTCCSYNPSDIPKSIHLLYYVKNCDLFICFQTQIIHLVGVFLWIWAGLISVPTTLIHTYIVDPVTLYHNHLHMEIEVVIFQIVK